MSRSVQHSLRPIHLKGMSFLFCIRKHLYVLVTFSLVGVEKLYHMFIIVSPLNEGEDNPGEDHDYRSEPTKSLESLDDVEGLSLIHIDILIEEDQG
mmetsp:Transcript_43470/g.41919  ORF Transcript_43470/g.41919 Transcript_43470/m.41919 type:complete len:96 (+) Transcript_43470:508-795(+)